MWLKKSGGKDFQKHSCWSHSILTEGSGSLTSMRAETGQQLSYSENPTLIVQTREGFGEDCIFEIHKGHTAPVCLQDMKIKQGKYFKD